MMTMASFSVFATIGLLTNGQKIAIFTVENGYQRPYALRNFFGPKNVELET